MKYSHFRLYALCGKGGDDGPQTLISVPMRTARCPVDHADVAARTRLRVPCPHLTGSNLTN